jgi:hypothetical protein
MKIKNWKLYLESNDSSNIDHVKDAFINLSDEYDVLVVDKRHGVYRVYINTGFILSVGSCLFKDKQSLKLHGENLRKLEKLNTLIEEAVSRFERVKFKVLYGTEEEFDWSEVGDEDTLEMSNLFSPFSASSFVMIDLNIRDKKTVDEICFLEGDTLIVNSDRIEKVINKCEFTLIDEIESSDWEISFRVNSKTFDGFVDKISILKKQIDLLLTSLKKDFGNLRGTERGRGISTYIRSDGSVSFSIQFDVNFILD